MTPPQETPPTPLPLTVVIGFLGAGKTSLLNALRDPAHAGTLVIINEFGEIGLDHLLVERTATCWCRIRAFCMRHAAPLAPAAFRSLPRIAAQGARTQALARQRHRGARRVIIQSVQHVFHRRCGFPDWPDTDHSARMVFILRDMEPSFIEALWQTLNWLVEPGAATCANTLALTKGGLLA